MKTIATLLFGAVLSTSVFAQTAPSDAPSQKASETPKVYHAGGKHDQRQHEAAIRARENGQKLEQTTMHAGGRHDVQSHEAAMRAEEKRQRDTQGK
jgi:hypothetical protein